MKPLDKEERFLVIANTILIIAVLVTAFLILKSEGII